MSNGSKMIADERQRQIDKEHYDLEHDLNHKGGELALAGACYACNASAWLSNPEFENLMGKYKTFSQHGFRWPFEEKHWKPRSPLWDLIRAGALIAAEIDRLLAVERSGR